MSRTLLFATDLSQENRAAFARALRLAHQQGAQLDVLHVLDPYLPPSDASRPGARGQR